MHDPVCAHGWSMFPARCSAEVHAHGRVFTGDNSARGSCGGSHTHRIPRRLLMTGCTMTDQCCIMCPDAPPTTQQLCPRCCSGWRVGIGRDRRLRWVESRQRRRDAEAEGGEEGRTWRQVQVREPYPATHTRTHTHTHMHTHTHTYKKIDCGCCRQASDGHASLPLPP